MRYCVSKSNGWTPFSLMRSNRVTSKEKLYANGLTTCKYCEEDHFA